VKAHIATAIEFLRGERIEALRLVRPEGVHLTLKFMGDIDAAQVPKVTDAMKRVFSQQTLNHSDRNAGGRCRSYCRAACSAAGRRELMAACSYEIPDISGLRCAH